MVEQVLVLFKDIFLHCALWTDKVLGAVGGKGVVLAAFTIVLVIGLLFIPMRGGSLVVGFDSLNDYASHAMYKGKYSQGAKKANYSKMGEFQKGNSKARSDRNAKLRSM